MPSSSSRLLRLLVLKLSFITATFLEQDEILLESFEKPRHTWKEMNDPVMGGRSTGSFRVQSGLGVFQGKVVDVPFLQAPGFIQARTTDHRPFPDISTCSAFKLTLQSHTDYTGYRFSFGNAHAPGGKMFAYGYKITLENVPMDGFGDLILPFDEFTDYWDDATGDPIVTCHEDSTFCPTSRALKNVQKLAIWGEGVHGEVSLDLRSISAVGCSSSAHPENNHHANNVKQRIAQTMLRGWKNQQIVTPRSFDFFF